jgi:NhaA family Na+:H+ antiporter
MIGFTVSLLVGELAFGAGSAQDQEVKIGVLVGSTAAAATGGFLLRRRARARQSGTAFASVAVES